jgi:hypothetical protein
MENTTPSKESVLEWMKVQIEFKKVQLELQELNTKISVYKMEEAKAIYSLAQLTSPPSNQEHDEHTITEEDIQANPELAQQGLKVGDVIGIPKIKTNIKENGTSKSS